MNPAASMSAPTTLQAKAGTGVDGGTVNMYVDNIEVVQGLPQVCQDIYVPPDAGVPTTTVAPGAYGCETPTKISAATYETNYAYIAGTTTLYVDGLLQRRGLDYQESSSNPKRLNFFAAVTGTVWVCYLAQGVGGGRGGLLEL